LHQYYYYQHHHVSNVNVANVSNVKKERMSNWTIGEQVTLVDLVLEHYDLLTIKQSNSQTNVIKHARCAQIMQTVNASGQQFRNVQQMRVKWDNLQAAAKTEFTDNLNYAREMSGGPRRRPIPAILLPIILLWACWRQVLGRGFG
jgi:hypothetical protein